jgi:hypothetical protein
MDTLPRIGSLVKIVAGEENEFAPLPLHIGNRDAFKVWLENLVFNSFDVRRHLPDSQQVEINGFYGRFVIYQNYLETL